MVCVHGVVQLRVEGKGRRRVGGARGGGKAGTGPLGGLVWEAARVQVCHQGCQAVAAGCDGVWGLGALQATLTARAHAMPCRGLPLMDLLIARRGGGWVELRPTS